MDRTSIVEMIHCHYETFWHGDLDQFDAQLSPSFVDEAGPPGTPPGPEPAKVFARMMRSGSSDMAITIEDTVVEGRMVAVRARWRGTHDGSLLGRAATGRVVEFEGMVFWRLDDSDQIERRWACLDTASLERQLDAVVSA